MIRGYDPVREETHWTLICEGIALGLLTAAIWFEAAQSLFDPETMIQQHTLVVIELVFILAFPTYQIISWITSFLSRRRITAWTLYFRQKALEDTASLCPPPSQDPLPITLPYTLHVRIGKGFLKQHSFELIVNIVLLAILFSITLNLSFTEQLRSISVLFVPFLLPLTGIISKLVASRSSTPMLTLTDDSITARYLADRITMRWDDVRYFMRIDQEQTFELSDDTNTIRWSDISARPNNPYVPAMEPTQYAALMQTLPHWICTRTGLPLYDVTHPDLTRPDINRS